MKPFKENYRIFALLGFFPSEKRPIRWKKILKLSILIFFATEITILLFASAVFALNIFSTDRTSAIAACFQICGLITVQFSLISAYIKRNELKEIFDQFQTFYDTSKSNIFIIIVQCIFSDFISLNVF